MAQVTYTVTVEDCSYERIQIWLDDADILHIQRGYNVYVYGAPTPTYKTAMLDDGIPWADVPVDIQNALVQIDAYTKERIAQIEGLPYP